MHDNLVPRHKLDLVSVLFGLLVGGTIGFGMVILSRTEVTVTPSTDKADASELYSRAGNRMDEFVPPDHPEIRCYGSRINSRWSCVVLPSPK